MTSFSVTGGGSAERSAPRIAAGTVRPVRSARLSAPTILSMAAISDSEGPMCRRGEFVVFLEFQQRGGAVHATVSRKAW